jgi:hypothetical protein
MNTLVGIFRSPSATEEALRELQNAGIAENQLLLTTKSLAAGDSSVATPEPESPGACGANMGHVAGAITGFAGGLIGAASTLLIPGVGPIVAIGTFALGTILGVAAGGAAGGALQESITPTLPNDDLFIYENALREGYWLLAVQPSDETQRKMAQDVFTRLGTESINTLRNLWWLGLRDAEAAAYDAPTGGFTQLETIYRRGFEAALDRRARGQSYEEALAFLQERDSDVYRDASFRRGYQRGQTYYRMLLAKMPTEQKNE